MAIDKAIDYVEQDGSLNFVKNSKSVTVPKEFKARKNAPTTKLAYITADEAKMLKKMKKGTPHKGPKGIPSYDSFDAQGGFTSGAAMSAAETGSKSASGRADVRSEFGPKGLAPGVTPNEVRDLRSSVIAAGAGQRVNPGFFDSRNVVSPIELARAKAFNPTAFRKGRGGGLGSFLSSGGFFGNIIRGLGRRLGFGKNYNEPTYDMSQFSNLGLFSPSINPMYDDFENKDMLDLNTNSKFEEYLDFRQKSPDAITFEEYLENIDKSPKGIMNTSSLPPSNLVAFSPGSLKDKQLKGLYNIFTETGFENPKMKDLMKEDIEQNQEKGTPLSLPKEAYTLIG
tara:strand:+ start:39 stop:1058 length:1020 start_codon:yes stop_codon:yes gene_type:complete